MALADYLSAVGLPQYLQEQHETETSVEQFIKASEDKAAALSEEEIIKLYSYKVNAEIWGINLYRHELGAIGR